MHSKAALAVANRIYGTSRAKAVTGLRKGGYKEHAVLYCLGGSHVS